MRELGEYIHLEHDENICLTAEEMTSKVTTCHIPQGAQDLSIGITCQNICVFDSCLYVGFVHCRRLECLMRS